ncbi:restriction endonuclease subunit S [Lacticaseibacillus rhamnosus]|uniref:restriction endonuclease subunit S n=1 Tax=Lacticaseibacillus rhamnosus TaxID=47715 RepID=UPI00237F8ABB|nr:restriction endonuclease subunit S [Lacticaseibacillus rhamnosus]MDE3303354.1 restriction endonuclease subunit S [Lacticaseibacillus rhamnosus]
MNAKQAKYPQLRFKGFTDPWEQRKVSELADRYDNLRVPITASERVAGETPYYGANGIQDYVEGFTHNGEFVLVAEDGANDLQNYPVQYVDGKVWVNNHAHVLQAKEERVDNKFLTNALKHTNIEPYLVGGGRAKLNADVMMKINFKVPTLPEQVQIGEFFDNLDHLITLHQRKLAKLKELKQGYLQKLFPKNGSKFPQLRFAGFADAWEQRKLGQVAEIVGGGTPSTTKPEYWDGHIDWYAPAEIRTQRYVRSSQKKITDAGLKSSSARMLPVGTVLFTSRAGIGKTAILATEASTNQGFQSIVPIKNELDSYFIFSRTEELKRYGEVNGAGSTFVEVSGKTMAKMPINIPSMEEQREIGRFFQRLDDTIALHQRKLEKLQELKKGYLQKMFC